MSDIYFKFCPFCGAAYKPDQQFLADKKCGSCGRVLYENQAATVGAVIMQGREILFVKRAVDPSQGKWDLPGGFVNPTETFEQAIIREVEEEVGVKSRVIELLGAFGPTEYVYQGRTQYNTDLYYLVEPLSHDFYPDDDASECRWFPLENLPPENELGFPSIMKVLNVVKNKIL